MIVRGIDAQNDWLYGKGRNDYRVNRSAVAQNVKTRLQSFIGDCFFQAEAGIDWFNLLGAKSEVAINLAVSAVILNTAEVTGIVDISSTLGENRTMTIQYRINTVYGVISNSITQGAFDA